MFLSLKVTALAGSAFSRHYQARREPGDGVVVCDIRELLDGDPEALAELEALSRQSTQQREAEQRREAKQREIAQQQEREALARERQRATEQARAERERLLAAAHEKALQLGRERQMRLVAELKVEEVAEYKDEVAPAHGAALQQAVVKSTASLRQLQQALSTDMVVSAVHLGVHGCRADRDMQDYRKLALETTRSRTRPGFSDAPALPNGHKLLPLLQAAMLKAWRSGCGQHGRCYYPATLGENDPTEWKLPLDPAQFTVYAIPAAGMRLQVAKFESTATWRTRVGMATAEHPYRVKKDRSGATVYQREKELVTNGLVLYSKAHRCYLIFPQQRLQELFAATGEPFEEMLGRHARQYDLAHDFVARAHYDPTRAERSSSTLRAQRLTDMGVSTDADRVHRRIAGRRGASSFVSTEATVQESFEHLALMRAEMLDHLMAAEDALRQLQQVVVALKAARLPRRALQDPLACAVDWGHLATHVGAAEGHPLLADGIAADKDLHAMLFTKMPKPAPAPRRRLHYGGGYLSPHERERLADLEARRLATKSVQVELDAAMALARRLYQDSSTVDISTPAGSAAGRRDDGGLEQRLWLGSMGQSFDSHGHRRFAQISETVGRLVALRAEVAHELKTLAGRPGEEAVPSLAEVKAQREREMRAQAQADYVEEQRQQAARARPGSPGVRGARGEPVVPAGRRVTEVYVVGDNGHQRFSGRYAARPGLRVGGNRGSKQAREQIFAEQSFETLRTKFQQMQAKFERRVNAAQRDERYTRRHPKNMNYDILGAAKANAMWKRCEAIANATTLPDLKLALQSAGVCEGDDGRMHVDLSLVRFEVKLLNRQGAYTAEPIMFDCRRHRHHAAGLPAGVQVSNPTVGASLFKCRTPATTKKFIAFVTAAHRRLQALEREQQAALPQVAAAPRV